jgi:PAS domain S-box-containing protein
VFLGVQSEASIGSRATAVLFILWGLHKFDYPFLRQHPVAAGWGFLLAALLGMGTAISILLHYLDVSKNALVRSEKLYRLLSERAHDMIFRYTFDPSPSFEYVSPSSTTLVGYSPEEHYADPSLAGKIVHPDDRAIFTSIPQSNTGDIRTFRVIHRDGRVIWLEQLSTILRNEKGRTIAVEGTIRDVSTRVEREEMLRRGEEHLHSAVREKDTLLQELHHLVNNNLAIILSLVDFEMRKYGGAVMPALRKIQRRVMSVALIHSLLYNGKDSRSLDFRQYCQSLVEHIRVTYPKPSARHEIVVSIAAGNLDIDRAKSCGLIISELVPNALEHAFGTGETQGRVEVTFSCESERCTLVVCDNGCGFPPDFDWRRKTNSGLFIVSSLCDQLDAHMNIQSTPGLRVEVSFPRKGR